MSRLAYRTFRNRGLASNRAFAMELLESRTLLTVSMNLNNGVLIITEDTPGLNNSLSMGITDSSGHFSIEEDNDTMVGNAAFLNAGWDYVPSEHAFFGPEGVISQIVIDLKDGQDRIQIFSDDLPVAIVPSAAASESVEIGAPPSAGLLGAQSVTGLITLNASAAHDAKITINDQTNNANVDPTIMSNDIFNFAGGPIHFTPPPQGNLTSAPMTIVCNTSPSTSGIIIDQDANDSAATDYQINCLGTGTVGIEQLNAKSQVLINADNGGSERVHLGSSGLISGVQGDVELSGNTGTVSLDVDDHNDTVAHTFATFGSSVFGLLEDNRQIVSMTNPSTAFTLETGPASNTVNLTLNIGLPGFVTTIDSSGANDTVNVNSLSSMTVLNIFAGTGVDNISFDAASVAGTVNVSSSSGHEAVTVDGSNMSTPQVITASDSQLIIVGGGSFTFANLASLSVTGGTASDNFSVTPSATVPITIDGGPFSGTQTDLLDLNLDQVTGSALALQTDSTGESGSYTFANRQPVSFTRLATTAPTFGDLTGTVYNGLTGAVVAGALVIVEDANQDTATTDASGTFSFQALPTGTFDLQASTSNRGNLSTVTATVSAGVLAAPVMIPVLPLQAVSGPDLVVASVVATAGGRTGSIKPKVRVKVSNLGPSMTSAAALQIVLVASPDTVLDSTDQQLLTSSTPPILLKTKGSKTLTLTGSTAASLTKGSYFVLASVDATNAVSETNEANNVSASANAVVLAPPAVDLTGKFGRLAKSASPSKLLPISFSIQNLGTIAAPGTIEFDFFASSDTTLDNSDVSLGTGFPVAVHTAAGKSQTAKFKLSISPSLPAGSYYLVAKVNSTSSISESDTTNNVVFSATPIAIS